MKQKGLIGIIVLVIVVLITLLVLSYFFVVQPHKIFGNQVIAPFKLGEYVLSESITYLFSKPAVGNRVIFTPQERYPDYVGIITKAENQNNVTTYTIISTGKGQPWVVSADKIKGRIYFPFLTSAEESTIDLLSQSTPVPSPSSIPESTGPGEITNVSSIEATWKTYTSTKYGISLNYPQSLQIEERKIQDYEVVNFTSEYKPPFSNYLDVGLLIYNTSDQVGLRNWVDKWVIQDLPTGKKGSIVSGNITPYKASNLEGLTFIGGKESEHKYVFFKQGSEIFGFQLSGSGTGTSYKENPRGEYILDQILSTFKFIN